MLQTVAFPHDLQCTTEFAPHLSSSQELPVIKWGEPWVYLIPETPILPKGRQGPQGTYPLPVCPLCPRRPPLCSLGATGVQYHPFMYTFSIC